MKEASQRIAFMLVVAVALGAAPQVRAQVGSCTPALGEAYLDINNVRARILNNGGLFYRGEPHVYEVPKGGGATALFAGGFWVGGQVAGQLRMASTRYGPWEFWAGPIDENGNPPADCSIYDKIWKISRLDIQRFEGGEPPALNLATWPTGLGAPTLAPAAEDGLDNDGDGEVDEPGEMKELHKELLELPLSARVNRVIDLAAGERPQLLGDQMLWWIMNDRGNSHGHSDTPPVGVEVHASAFAFNQSGDIGNTTFYKLNMFMKANDALENAYVSIWSDPDLGDFQDDYVGSDTTLGIGFVYNSDNLDGSAQGYGENPPALGYDFFQGPIVPSPGDTAHVSGVAVPDFRNLKMTSFVRFNNTSGPSGDPGTGTDVYSMMQARWKDGRAIRAHGDGYDAPDTAPIVSFMFPGDPATNQFWSEVNAFPDGSSIEPADRRFIVTAGPFTINPGDQQEIVYGIVWARGNSNLDSVTRMRSADAFAQAAFDANFELPRPPDQPIATFTPLDGEVAIEWTNPPTSNNYLDTYREFNPLVDPSNPDYVMEGYEVYQFSSPQDQDGVLIASYDIANGVTTVVEDADGDGIPTQTAAGRDNGIQHSHIVQGLTNYQSYYFGVRAYAYNPLANPQVYRSPFARATVQPFETTAVLSEEAVDAVGSGEAFAADVTAGNVGAGSVRVRVANAAAVRNCEYRVQFYALPAGKMAATQPALDVDAQDAVPVGRIALDAAKTPGGETTYDIFCGDEKVFDGSASGSPAPQRANVLVVDGLEFSVLGPEPGFERFLVVSNAAGPLDPPDMGTFAFNANGFPTLDGLPPNNVDNDRPSDRQQVGAGHWGINAGGGTGTFASFMSRSIRQGLEVVGPYDYEIRFTEECAATIDGTATADDCLGWRAFDDGADIELPFELWRTGIGTPDDPSDDVRLLPGIADNGAQFVFDLGADHPVSGGTDDPETDWIYFYMPTDESPGQAGYDCFFALTCDGGVEIMARQVLVNWNGRIDSVTVNQDLPESGTTFRYMTFKPSQPGDSFTFSTAALASAAPSLDEQKARLKDIGIVPNPYKGASSYEVSQIIDEVRFTNLPDVATIRVFTLNGTLLRTIVKNSPGQRTLSWDLTTDTLLPLASGMYLIHVEVPGVGEHVIKFGVVKKRVHLNVF